MKIGLLIESENVNFFQKELVQSLSHLNVDIVCLQTVIENYQEIKNIRGVKGLVMQLKFRTLFNKACFAIWSRLEKHFLRLYLRDSKYFNKYNLNSIIDYKLVRIKGRLSKSGLITRYKQKSIELVRSLELDVIIRVNSPGIFKGEILTASKFGIISFHHGDNRWNRGSPPGFWEVYKKHDSTGFIIQILTEDLDAGKVLFRGSTITQAHFWMLNYHNIQKESYPYIVAIIKKIMNSGEAEIEQEAIFDNKLLVAPTALQLFYYQVSILKRLVIRSFSKIIGIRDVWNIYFLFSDSHNISLRKAIRIRNNKGAYFADPFHVQHNDRNIIFTEEYFYGKKKGVISAIEVLGKNSYKYLGTVIEEDFHLSYPFVFNYKNELFMIPESASANSIRLYKCVKFPIDWIFEKELMTGVSAADTTLIFHNQMYWMFTNINRNTTEHNSLLECFYSNSPISDDWKPHNHNPIRFENGARNGGIIKSDNGTMRVSQVYDFDRYGKSVRVNKIKKLSASEFEECIVQDVLPNFDKRKEGLHHYYYSNGLVCFDAVHRGFK